MPEPASASFGATKVIALALTVGTGVFAAAATLSDAPLPPAPSLSASMEALIGVVMVWALKELREVKKAGVIPPEDIKVRDSFREAMLKGLEDLAFGNRDVAKELKDHRIEFSKFAGGVEERFKSIERRVSRQEDHLESRH